jgi:hypothetical protein
MLGRSVEQPWNDNKRFISCVPAGEYELIPYNSTKYGFVYMLKNPELSVYPFESQCESDSDRYGCIFAHRGSYPHNFQGCIGLGDHYIESLNMVKNTRQTCKEAMEFLSFMDERHTLIINRGGYID